MEGQLALIITAKTTGDKLALTQWACDILGETLEIFGFDRNGEPLFAPLGFVHKDELVCVVVAYNYTPPNISVAFASSSPKWATKGNIAALGQWIFDDLGCERATAFVHKSNKRARKFDEGIGFKVEGKLRKASLEGDILVYGLLKRDHHAWLRKAFRHGQEGINNGHAAGPV